jgi:hypothetical protein
LVVQGFLKEAGAHEQRPHRQGHDNAAAGAAAVLAPSEVSLTVL